MSLSAMVWALKNAPIPKDEPIAQLILIGLADHANDDGTDARPSIGKLAEYAHCSTRTVQRKLAVLEEAGLIARGDQRAVSHLPANRRPVVWDLLILGPRRTPTPVDNSELDVTACHPNEALGCHTSPARGDTPVNSGVTLLSYKPSIEPSIEPGGDYVRNSLPADPPVENSPLQNPALVMVPAPPEPTTASATDVPEPQDVPDGSDAMGAQNVNSLDVPGARGDDVVVDLLRPVCEAHRWNPAPPPCHACKEARVAYEAGLRRRAEGLARAARDRERAERVAEEERVRALRADPEEQAAIEALKAELRNKFSKQKARVRA